MAATEKPVFLKYLIEEILKSRENKKAPAKSGGLERSKAGLTAELRLLQQDL